VQGAGCRVQGAERERGGQTDTWRALTRRLASASMRFFRAPSGFNNPLCEMRTGVTTQGPSWGYLTVNFSDVVNIWR